jgi:hypothetical protein
MIISHPRGLYTILVDTSRRIVYEAPLGVWKKEDYMEYHSLYMNVIVPTLGEGAWSICTDLRKYRISDIEDVMNHHIDWLSENNIKYCAIIVDSAMVKIQIDKVLNTKILQQAFLEEAEADMWLKSIGF